jgi:hypothetical protein
LFAKELFKSCSIFIEALTSRHDARQLLQMPKQLMGKKPTTFITDGLPTCHIAYKKDFWTLKNPRTEHIRHITPGCDHNNNKMERMDKGIHDEEKTMHGLKTKDAAILKGHQIYHNCIRPHEVLEGKTFTEVCGLRF